MPAAGAGLVVAWAYLSDPYYAVCCMLMLLFVFGYAVTTVQLPEHRPRWSRGTLTVLIVFRAPPPTRAA